MKNFPDILNTPVDTVFQQLTQGKPNPKKSSLFDSPSVSVWQRLVKREITLTEAINLLVDEEENVNLDLLDAEVENRFFKIFRDRKSLPPVMPLLLWQQGYYLGSPIILTLEDIEKLTKHQDLSIQIIPISKKSYRLWDYNRKRQPDEINADGLIDPLTGETESEDFQEITQFHLSQGKDQIEKVKTLLSGSLFSRASDIHLEPTPEGLRVRYRVDGVLRYITTIPPDVGRKVVVTLKVMSNMDISESRRPQDGRIAEKYTEGEVSELGLDMRINTLPCMDGEKVVIRLLPQRNPFNNMGSLGFSAKSLPIYQHWLTQPQGMIVLTGPTGSGKTSTLYTSLQQVTTDAVNVVTVEDPVEYRLGRITQTQVNEAAGMTFAAGLRAILRQDPDIIMIGEIRDSETAETAFRAALTGHLVFTTLHTNDAVGAIPRLKDIGPDPGLISDALLGVVAQRLVRRVCPHCSQSYQPTDEELRLLGLKRGEISLDGWRKGEGCRQCFQSGYLGREAIIELLEINDSVREIIYEGSITQMRRYLSKIDFHSFRKAAIDKITAGITTLEEVRRVLPHNVLVV